MNESDLYLPLKTFLEGQGYEVKGEIDNCDVLAIRENEDPVVVELKLNVTFTVLLQAVDRLALTDTVYIGVPTDCRALAKNQRDVMKLLRRLGFGLILIDAIGDRVDVLLDPGDYTPKRSKKRQQRMLAEFAHRVGDPQAGGVGRRKGLMTAYRQKALRIGEYLLTHGPSKASNVAREVVEPKSRAILYRNVYGWFERVSTGVYSLSPRGKEEIIQWR